MATRFTSQGNAAGLLDVGNDAVEPIRKKRVVLNVWPGNKTRKQIGSALIKNLVVYDGDRVLDILPCHKESCEMSFSGIFESSSNRQRDTLSCRKLL